jgi:hypothetical protein
MLCTITWVIEDESQNPVANRVYLRKKDAETVLSMLQDMKIWKNQKLTLAKRTLVICFGMTDQCLDRPRRDLTMATEEIKIRRYTLPSISGIGGWAVIIIDSTGYFSCVSDFGNYAYWWTSIGVPDFRTFLCGLDKSYLCSKLNARKVWDGDGTLRNVQKCIEEGGYDPATEKSERALLEEYDLTEKFDFYQWLQETEIQEAWRLESSCPDPDTIAFAECVYPRFVELLRAELAAEDGH